MAYTISNLSQGTVATGAACTIPKPSGLAVNDLLIAQCIWYNFSGVTSVTPASGWTQIEFTSVGGAGPATATFYKLATSTEVAASNFTFTSDGSGDRVNIGAIFTIRGAKESNPGYVKAEATGSSGTTITVGTITPSVASSLLLFFVAGGISAGGTQSFSAYACATSNPTWTELYDLNGTSGSDVVSIACAYATRPETTGTGNLTATQSQTNQPWAAHVAALQPGIDFSVSDTMSLSDNTPKMSLSFVKSETITLSDVAVAEDDMVYTNPDKPSTTWINPDK